MQEESIFPSTQIIETPGCINCKNPSVVDGYPNALCQECRETFIKYPIPAWVKGVGIGVVILIGISYFLNSKIYDTHRHMTKALNFVDDKKLYSASKEFRKVLEKDSTNIEAHGMLMYCEYYTDNQLDMFANYFWLTSRQTKEDEVSSEILKIPNYIIETYPDDTLSETIKNIDSLHLNKVEVLTNFIASHTDNQPAKYYLADTYYDLDNIDLCDSILNDLIDTSPRNVTYLALKAAVLRRQEKYKDAFSICDKLFDDNKESCYAYIIKAKILCSNNQLKEARASYELALKYADNYAHDVGVQTTKLFILKKENNMSEYNQLLASMREEYKDSKESLDYIQQSISKFN